MKHWIPETLFLKNDKLCLRWAYIGNERFTDPFFQHSLIRCKYKFQHLHNRIETPFDFLLEQSLMHEGVKPLAFIFHMSRCGSTLIAQTFVQLLKNIVLAEPPAIDTLLRIQNPKYPISDQERIKMLRAIVNVFCQKRHSQEKYAIIKWDSWSIFNFPIINRAFPDVPWIFLYRKPIEVMSSQLKKRGMHMVPGLVDGETFGLDPNSKKNMSINEYGVRVLAAICKAAIKYHNIGTGSLINYNQISKPLLIKLSKFFGMTFTDAESLCMSKRMLFDAKKSTSFFNNDVTSKTGNVSVEIVKHIDHYLTPVYDELEAIRLSSAII